MTLIEREAKLELATDLIRSVSSVFIRGKTFAFSISAIFGTFGIFGNPR